MREIKFRAWSNQNKRMYYATFGIGAFHTNGEWWAVEDGTETYKASSVYNNNLMQFTGLKDKNGKEIYEGDITNHGIVYWEESSCSFRLRDVHKICWNSFEINILGHNKEPIYGYDTHDINAYTTPFEVIGNIYENPELLEVSP